MPNRLPDTLCMHHHVKIRIMNNSTYDKLRIIYIYIMFSKSRYYLQGLSIISSICVCIG